MKIKINKIILLNVSVVIVTLFIGWVFIYMPFSNKHSFLKDEILLEEARNVLIAKVNILNKHLAFYKSKIPEGKDDIWLLREVSDMLTQEGVELISIKPGSLDDNILYIKLYVTLDTVSTYNQLARFISRVESSEFFLKVENINMKRLDLDEDFDKYKDAFKGFDIKASLVVSTIVLKESRE